MKLLKKSALSLALALGIGALIGLPTQTASAQTLDGDDFPHGRIIEDAIFTDSTSMTVQEIQSFLESRVRGGECDRHRATYNDSYNPPWTCLFEFQQNPDTGDSNYGLFDDNGTPSDISDDTPASISGGKSAAEIIWQAGQDHDINPQVLIILLEKEQSLITDNWPWTIQYSKATGYLCPDTAPCDSGQADFFKQVDGAARLFRFYLDNLDLYWYQIGTNEILYNPNHSCGRRTVEIENAATVALYLYTPYTPNQAALDNLYGTGDSCSAYGNRNFWRLFNDWFGATSLPSTVTVTNGIDVDDFYPQVGKPVSASFSIRNGGDEQVMIESMKATAVDSQGNKYPYQGAFNTLLASGETIDYLETREFDEQETYSIRLGLKIDGTWSEDNYTYANGSIERELTVATHPFPEVIEGPNIDKEIPLYVTQDGSFTIQNFSDESLLVQSIKLAGRVGTSKVNFDGAGSISLGPDETYTYAAQRTFNTESEIKLSYAIKLNNTWLNQRDIVGSAEAALEESYDLQDALVLTAPPAFSKDILRNGEVVSGTFSIRNTLSAPLELGQVKLIVEDELGNRRPFSSRRNIVIAPGDTYNYTSQRTFETGTGLLRAWVSLRSSDGTWFNNVITNEDGDRPPETAARIADGLVLSQALQIPSQASRSETVDAEFTILNNGDSAALIESLKVGVRSPEGSNVSFASEKLISLEPDEEFVYSASSVFDDIGSHTVFIAAKVNGEWLELNTDALDLSSPTSESLLISL